MPHRIMPVAAPRPPAGFGAGQPSPVATPPPAPTALRPPALVQAPRPPQFSAPAQEAQAPALPVLQPGMKVSLAPPGPTIKEVASSPSFPQGPFNPPRVAHTVATERINEAMASGKVQSVKPAALTGKVSVATSEGTGTIEQLRASHDKVMRVRNAFIEMISAVLDVIKG